MAVNHTYSEQQFALGRLLYHASCVSCAQSTHQRLWMSDISSGDTVIELSAHFKPWRDSIGILLHINDRPLLDEDGVKYSTEPEWVLQTMDHAQLTWVNASFARIPTTRHERDLFQGYGQKCAPELECTACARERWDDVTIRDPRFVSFRQILRQA